MIIGDKNVFAVEMIVDKNYPNMGYGKLWFQNNFIGTRRLHFLKGYLIGLVNKLIESKPLEVNVEHKMEKEIFDMIKSSDNDRSEYAIMGSTFTDDFDIYSFRKLNEIFIYWRIRDDEMIFDELRDYSKKIHTAKVDKRKLEEVKDQVLEKINLAFL